MLETSNIDEDDKLMFEDHDEESKEESLGKKDAVATVEVKPCKIRFFFFGKELGKLPRRTLIQACNIVEGVVLQCQLEREEVLVVER